jgi:hypothetical protein
MGLLMAGVSPSPGCAGIKACVNGSIGALLANPGCIGAGFAVLNPGCFGFTFFLF